MYILRGLSLQLFGHFKQKNTTFFGIIVQNSRNSRLEHAKIVSKGPFFSANFVRYTI